MSAIETLLRPQKLRQIVPNPDISDLTLLQQLWDLFTWARGTARAGPSLKLSASLPANTTTNFDLQPDAKTPEEWEILVVHVQDQAGIDATDIVEFVIQDAVIVQGVMLQRSQLQATSFFSGNSAIFPNRIQAGGAAGVEVNPPVRLRRRDTGESWLKLTVSYTSTATAGNRNVNVIPYYYARPIL